MNNKIIQKCIDELKKETFSKEYILGMLETIVEMSGGSNSLSSPVVVNNTGLDKTPVIQSKTEEDLVLEKYLNGTTKQI